ncbi:hypothetical protein Tco_1561008 [Tanacetum coccineum]
MRCQDDVVHHGCKDLRNNKSMRKLMIHYSESRSLDLTLSYEMKVLKKVAKLHLSMYGKAAQLEKQMFVLFAASGLLKKRRGSGRVEVCLTVEMGRTVTAPPLYDYSCQFLNLDKTASQKKEDHPEGFHCYEKSSCFAHGLRTGLKFSGNLDHVPQRVYPRSPRALCLRCLHEECQFLLPGDDGDYFSFRDGPDGLAEFISTGSLGWRGQVILGRECPVDGLLFQGELSGLRCWKVIENILEYDAPDQDQNEVSSFL